VSDELLLERILGIINEGKRAATYKLALLLALIDAAVMGPENEYVETSQIAESVLLLYFPQVGPYTTLDGSAVDLRNMTAKSSEFVRTITDLRTLGTHSSFRTLNQIRTYLPDDYVKALKTVEYVFKINPIPRLQNVGDSSVPFLYTYSTLDAEDGNKDVHRSGNRIEWLPGVAQRLVVLGPALRPLIEQHWMADVARWSNISTEAENLQQHLFGQERRRFPSSLREGLSDLQDGKCFYCGGGFSDQRDIDHFIPWARWPNDAIENLVLADNCNSQKSDSLAAITHLNRWIERNSVHAAKLSDLADQTEVVSAPERSLALAKSTYRFLDENSPLWLAKKEFELRGWLEISALS